MTTMIAARGLASCAALILMLAGCSSAGTSGATAGTPATAPTPTVMPAAPAASAMATPEETEAHISTVPKIRAEWNVDTAALAALGEAASGSSDIDLLRADTCSAFLAANPLIGDLPAPSLQDKLPAVEARYLAKQELLRDYVSDVFRDDQWSAGSDAAAALTGVDLCLTNGMSSAGSELSVLLDAVASDRMLPSVDTVPRAYSLKDMGEGYVRTSFVTVTVEGEAPRDLWRRFRWNETVQDWDLVNEQAENPYNLGWK